MVVARLLITIEDNTNFIAEGYGGIAGGLTNGLSLSVWSNGAFDFELTHSSHPIKANVDWASYCYDFNYSAFGSGNNYANIRWTLERAGSPVKLKADDNDWLQVRVSDTLSTLVDHRIIAQGHYLLRDQ
jgi:hypothetical protein